MKKNIILFLSILFITIFSSCNNKNASQDLGNNSDDNESINESSILGAWKYDDSYFGIVYIQFELAGIIKVFYNYEGENLEVGGWQIQGNKIIITNCNIIQDLIISDLKKNSFKFPIDSNAIQATKDDFNLVNRLLDEAGEPIFHYSLFDKVPVEDPRYDNGASNSTNNESEGNSSSSSSSNSQPASYKCKWCGNSYSQYGWRYNRTAGDCTLYGESQTAVVNLCRMGYEYCSQKCASEACNAEN